MDSTIKYNKKKIFLLKVPQIEFPSKGKRDLSTTRNPYFSLPLSLGYLGGFLREYGGDQFDVKLEDVNTRTIIEAGKKILDTHAFAEMMRFLIENTTYDVIGISSVFANNADWVKLAVTYAKEFHPGKPVILGGGYTTIFAKESLEDTKADFAVIGEGEDTLLGLLNNIFAIKNERYTDLFKEPSGYAHRLNNGEIKVLPRTAYIKDLDIIPLPAWDLLNIDSFYKLFPDRKNEIFALTSRGCPYRCNYCSTHLAWGGKYTF